MTDLDYIKELVEIHFKVDLRKKTRLKKVANARFYFYYLCRKHTFRTYQNIADYINKNHASIIHGENKIKGEADVYIDVRENIRELESKINLRDLRFQSYKEELEHIVNQIDFLKKRKIQTELLIRQNE